MFYCYQNWSELSLMQVKDDDDLYKGQRLTQVKCDKQYPIDLHWPEESLSKLKMMTFLKVKGQQRSNVVNYVPWLPYLVTWTVEARLIQKCIHNMRLCSDLFTNLISYTVAVCDCVFHLYDFFLLLSSSVNTSLTYISDMTWPILTRLGHKYRVTTQFMSHDQIRVKGHVGGHRGQKCHFH